MIIRLALVVLVCQSLIGAAMPARASTTCLLSPEVARSGKALPGGLWGLIPARTDSGSRVEFTCSAGGVAGITMHLRPGQAGRAELLLTGRSIHRAALSSDEGMPSSWSRIEFWSPDPDSTAVTVIVEVPDSADVGATYSVRVRIGDDRSGVSIPLTVRLTDEAPLFRDTFDVDPVIGQFSQVW